MTSFSVLETRDANEIWEIISSDQKVEITFFTRKDAEKFRIRLHQVKMKSEKIQLAIGFLSPGEVLSLKFELVSGTPAPDTPYTYMISLGKKKRDAIRYAIRIVE